MTTNRLRRRIALAALVLAWAPLCQAQLAVISPTFVDFGEIKMGAIVQVPVSVRNVSGQPLTLAGGGIGGTNFDSFSFGGTSGGCAPIPVGGTCTINYRFQPRSASQTVTDWTVIGVGTGTDYQERRVEFQGTGGETLVQVTPRGIEFGEEMVGNTLSYPVTITNTHSAPLNFAGGGVDGSFDGTSNCSASLAAGASCQVTYTFTPGQVGETQANSTIQLSTGTPSLIQNYEIQLRGRGRTTPPNAVAWPVAFDYGAVKLGDEVVLPYYRSNRTANPLNTTGGAIPPNENHNLFQSAAETLLPGCTGNQAGPGATCEKRVRFLPRERRTHLTTTGIGLATLDNVQVFFQPMAFTGLGVGRLARLSPVEIEFGDLQASQWAQVTVTLRNTSPHTLTNLQGGNVTGNYFSRPATTCGSTLASGASCTYTYQFTPQQAGNFLAITIVAYQAAGITETNQITLTGTSGTAIFINGFD